MVAREKIIFDEKLKTDITVIITEQVADDRTMITIDLPPEVGDLLTAAEIIIIGKTGTHKQDELFGIEMLEAR